MNITTAYRQMAQDSYNEAMAAHAIVLESAEETQLDESAIKSQIIKDGYIYFPDGNLMYKINPYKSVGNYKQGKPGDYLMKGIDGELYICDGPIFERTYDFVK